MINENEKTVLCALDDSNIDDNDDGNDNDNGESSRASQRRQPSLQENGEVEDSLAENLSIAAVAITTGAGEEESVASSSMPITEIRFQQEREERLLRRSLNNDTELMMKIVQERISLAHDGVGEFGDSINASGGDQEDQSAIMACAAAGVPGAYHTPASASSLGAAPRGGDLLRSSVGSANTVSVDCEDLKTGERPASYYEQAFARVSSESMTAIKQEATAEVVGAIAVGGPACEERSSCSARTSACSATEFETSADLTYTVTEIQPGSSSSTVTPSTFLTGGGTQALAVAAEVAPEMLDLERSITSRVRAELENSMRVSSEIAFENAPLAEIVGRMDRNAYAKESQERQRRYRILAVVACTLLVAGAVTLGVVFGTQKNGYNYPPDNNSIADVPETICYERIPMLGKSKVCPPQAQGSGSTNLVAASRLWNAPEAEISILNAGEVRIDIEQGNFTMGEARELLIFDSNTLVLIHIKGSKLVTALERGIQKIFDDKAAEEGLNSTTPSGAFPYGAGIRWNVNMSQPFPRRLFDIQVNPRFEGQWQELDLHRVYTIVTNSYLAGGGDAYHEFSSAEDEHVIDTGMQSLESFVEYCQYFGVLLNPPEDHYSTQTYTHSNLLF